MENENHNSSPPDVNIALICLAMVLITFIMGLFFMSTEPHKENNVPVKTVNESTYISRTELPTEPPTTLPIGFYPEDNDYIPAGYYIIIAKDKYDYAADWIVATEYESDEDNGMYSIFQYSSIVKIKDGWYFIMTMCDAYSLDTFNGENNPFEHSGMFRVGIDVPAGTYKIIPTTDKYCAEWAIHEDIDSIDYEKINRSTYDKTAEDIEVTLKDGNILELLYCKLEEN